MLFNEKSIQFQGFHPSEFTKSYLEEKMNELHAGAPYGSTLKALYTRKDSTFKGIISIYSSGGHFFATASGNQMKEVNHRLVEQIKKQLKRWKSARHNKESLRDRPVKTSLLERLRTDNQEDENVESLAANF